MAAPVVEVAPAVGDVVDCGFVAGERYWITRRGVAFPNGALLEDTTGCEIPVGVTFAIRWGDTPGFVIETHAACRSAADEAEQIAALVKRARAVLDAQHADPATVTVRAGDCAERRRVDIESTGG